MTSNYPPGVTGREWQITGEDPDEWPPEHECYTHDGFTCHICSEPVVDIPEPEED